MLEAFRIILLVSFCPPLLQAAQSSTPLSIEKSLPVIIDAGHGGHDLGAVVNGVYEKNIALSVANKLRDSLKDKVSIVMTREDDSLITLDQRVNISSSAHGLLFISIHLNKIPNKDKSGITVYSYAKDNYQLWRRPNAHPHVPPLPPPPRAISKRSAQLAQLIDENFRLGGYPVTLDKSDYYVLKNPDMPSVLVEIGYLSNPSEKARLMDSAYQQKIADILAKSVLTFTAR